jgi:hypothetical protein
MSRLTSLLAAAIALAAGACGTGPRPEPPDDGVTRCYGGFGLVVQVERGVCTMPIDLTKMQLTLRSNGAEKRFDYGFVPDVVAEGWPFGFARGDTATIDAIVYADGGACRLEGTASAVVDPEVCATVDVATSCTCK